MPHIQGHVTSSNGGAGTVDQADTTSGYPTDVLSALEAMGLSDYAYMFSGDPSKIASQLGLSSKQAEEFSKYLQPFGGKRFDELIGGIPEWQQQQMQLLKMQDIDARMAARAAHSLGLEKAGTQRQLGTASAELAERLGLKKAGFQRQVGTEAAERKHGASLESLRARAFEDFMGASQLGETFAGSGAAVRRGEATKDVLGTSYGGMQDIRGATLRELAESHGLQASQLGQQKQQELERLGKAFGLQKSQLSQTKEDELKKLGLLFTSGKQQIGEQADVRYGQAYGTLQDYINQVLGLGAQFSMLDPGGGGTGGGGYYGGGGKTPIGTPKDPPDRR